MKKVFIVLICLFLNLPLVNASTKTYDRLEEKNYGVNKHWNITDKNINNVKNTKLVDASEKVYDFADILTDDEEQQIYDKINNFIEKNHMDMVFVSIDMPYNYDKQNEDYAADFYDYNDFGIDFDNYSGILLLRNNYENDKYYDIYTFGDAQLYFNQTRYDDVLDSIYSAFVSKNYLRGIERFIDRCDSYIHKGYASNYKYSYIDKDGYIHTNYHAPIGSCLFASAIITLIIMIILIRKNKMIKKATKANEYLDKNSIKYTENIDQFLRSHTSHYTVSSSSGSSGGGGHHSSGSSGGGHSSGGGRHG